MPAYEIAFAESVEKHLNALTARDRQTILAAISRSLRHEPTVITRNRKPMRPNPLAAWELRVGNFRVYYRVFVEPDRMVEIAAVGVKRGDEIWIGGERVDL